MNIIKQPSPNFDSREGQKIDMLVLHYTGMKTGRGAIEKLCDTSAKVSAHYVVEEDGRVLQLVEEKDRAWHAGISFWRGNTNINQRSIGIEIVNPGHEYGYRPFTLAQMEAVIALCEDIVKRHKIPARNVVGHSDVAPARKQDPGELFDWEWLAQKKVGLSADSGAQDNTPSITTLLNRAINGLIIAAYFAAIYIFRHKMTPWDMLLLAMFMSMFFGYGVFKQRNRRAKKDSNYSPKQVQEKLLKLGYSCPQTGEFDAETGTVITAFQRHFRRKSLTGKWDSDCLHTIDILLSNI